jgi:hypothetical protein
MHTNYGAGLRRAFVDAITIQVIRPAMCHIGGLNNSAGAGFKYSILI